MIGGRKKKSKIIVACAPDLKLIFQHDIKDLKTHTHTHIHTQTSQKGKKKRGGGLPAQGI